VNAKQTVTKAKQGDKDALASLYRQSFASLYKFVFYKVNNVEIAEDICQESFTKGFAGLANFREEASFKTYVYTIARNLVIDHYKVKNISLSLHENINLPATETTENGKASEEVRQILEKLNDREQQILELRYLSGFNVAETAEALGLTVANVKVLTYRALRNAQKLCLNLNK
jgi:RNA polymerase sigma-70 factor (ECF subfamily)